VDVTSSEANIEGELARLSAGTMRAGEMLEASRRLMATAKGAQWSRAATHHGDALYANGRIAEAMVTFEEAWGVADRLADPIAGALAAALAGASCAKLYDFPRAEEWYSRELGRARSRLVPDWRYGLTVLLASARVSQGDLAGARELLDEFEGAASNHFLLAYAEGDWEHAVLLRRRELEAARAADRLQAVGDCASLLGRFARVGNQRIEAEAYLKEGLAAAVAWPDLNRELFIRIELTVLEADRGRIEKAKAQLTRCQAILANGEDWRGHRGAFAYASALVSAADCLRAARGSDDVWRIPLHNGGELRLPDEVAEGFRAAIAVFRHYRAPWEAAGAEILWSRALFAAARHRASAEKYNAGFARLDRIAPPLFRERMQAEVFRFITLDPHSSSSNAAAAGGSNVFRKEGEYWTILFEGSVFRLRDTIGMHYIGRLVANPGVEFSAKDLAASARPSSLKRGGRTKAASSHSGRLNGDRDLHDDAARERARLMVTKRIKDVVTKIRLTHPKLARHFATRIRTGYTCTYVIDEEDPRSWTT
jgi:tetratricopeptide (TPR) repeat protein